VPGDRPPFGAIRNACEGYNKGLIKFKAKYKLKIHKLTIVVPCYI